jgi:hypothetical protein
MNPQPDHAVVPEQVPEPRGLLDAQWLADLEEDRLERELLEAELGGEG